MWSTAHVQDGYAPAARSPGKRRCENHLTIAGGIQSAELSSDWMRPTRTPSVEVDYGMAAGNTLPGYCCNRCAARKSGTARRKDNREQYGEPDASKL
jgi:hypothetical protein